MEKIISIRGDELYDAADLFDAKMQDLLNKMRQAKSLEGKITLTVSVELVENFRPDTDTGDIITCYMPDFRCKAKSTVMLSDEESFHSRPNVVIRHKKDTGWTAKEDNGDQMGLEGV